MMFSKEHLVLPGYYHRVVTALLRLYEKLVKGERITGKGNEFGKKYIIRRAAAMEMQRVYRFL
jgi:hypothetical protein